MGNQLRQYFADLMRGVEFTPFFTRRGGKLADEVFINFTENIFAVISLVLHAIHQFCNAIQCFGTGDGGIA